MSKVEMAEREELLKQQRQKTKAEESMDKFKRDHVFKKDPVFIDPVFQKPIDHIYNEIPF